MRRGLFTKDTVRDMLANRLHRGELPVFVPGVIRRVREWQDGRHEALIEEEKFTAVRQAITSRAAGTKTNTSVNTYSLSGLLPCVHCCEQMRVVRTQQGRVRHLCRSMAQGIGCTCGGSYLDGYKGQIAANLAHFILPSAWQQFVLDAASRAGQARHDGDPAAQRHILESRLSRLTEVYTWGTWSGSSIACSARPSSRRLQRSRRRLGRTSG